MEKKLEPKVKDESPRKLSYEDMENLCHQLSAQAQQLSAQNQQLRTALGEANLTNLYKRLDYLFDIIYKDSDYLSYEFKKKCAEEIERIMTAPEESEETEDNKD